MIGNYLISYDMIFRVFGSQCFSKFLVFTEIGIDNISEGLRWISIR